MNIMQAKLHRSAIVNYKKAWKTSRFSIAYSLETPSQTQRKKTIQTNGLLRILVRVTGLEPVRQRHTPLKRACLPIPAHSRLLRAFLLNSRYYITVGDNCQ